MSRRNSRFFARSTSVVLGADCSGGSFQIRSERPRVISRMSPRSSVSSADVSGLMTVTTPGASLRKPGGATPCPAPPAASCPETAAHGEREIAASQTTANTSPPRPPAGKDAENQPQRWKSSRNAMQAPRWQHTKNGFYGHKQQKDRHYPSRP